MMESKSEFVFAALIIWIVVTTTVKATEPVSQANFHEHGNGNAVGNVRKVRALDERFLNFFQGSSKFQLTFTNSCVTLPIFIINPINKENILDNPGIGKSFSRWFFKSNDNQILAPKNNFESPSKYDENQPTTSKPLDRSPSIRPTGSFLDLNYRSDYPNSYYLPSEKSESKQLIQPSNLATPTKFHHNRPSSSDHFHSNYLEQGDLEYSETKGEAKNSIDSSELDKFRSKDQPVYPSYAKVTLRSHPPSSFEKAVNIHLGSHYQVQPKSDFSSDHSIYTVTQPTWGHDSQVNYDHFHVPQLHSPLDSVVEEPEKRHSSFYHEPFQNTHDHVVAPLDSGVSFLIERKPKYNYNSNYVATSTEAPFQLHSNIFKNDAKKSIHRWDNWTGDRFRLQNVQNSLDLSGMSNTPSDNFYRSFENNLSPEQESAESSLRRQLVEKLAKKSKRNLRKSASHLRFDVGSAHEKKSSIGSKLVSKLASQQNSKIFKAENRNFDVIPDFNQIKSKSVIGRKLVDNFGESRKSRAYQNVNLENQKHRQISDEDSNYLSNAGILNQNFENEGTNYLNGDFDGKRKYQTGKLLGENRDKFLDEDLLYPKKWKSQSEEQPPLNELHRLDVSPDEKWSHFLNQKSHHADRRQLLDSQHLEDFDSSKVSLWKEPMAVKARATFRKFSAPEKNLFENQNFASYRNDKSKILDRSLTKDPFLYTDFVDYFKELSKKRNFPHASDSNLMKYWTNSKDKSEEGISNESENSKSTENSYLDFSKKPQLQFHKFNLPSSKKRQLERFNLRNIYYNQNPLDYQENFDVSSRRQFDSSSNSNFHKRFKPHKSSLDSGLEASNEKLMSRDHTQDSSDTNFTLTPSLWSRRISEENSKMSQETQRDSIGMQTSYSEPAAYVDASSLWSSQMAPPQPPALSLGVQTSQNWPVESRMEPAVTTYQPILMTSHPSYNYLVDAHQTQNEILSSLLSSPYFAPNPPTTSMPSFPSSSFSGQESGFAKRSGKFFETNSNLNSNKFPANWNENSQIPTVQNEKPVDSNEPVLVFEHKGIYVKGSQLHF